MLMPDSMLLLAIDTCGPSGSVALGRSSSRDVEILSQIELEGRSYSSTLVEAVKDVLSQNGVELRQVSCIVVVNGPGSFTGVRVGVSAAKGLAEAAQIPVTSVSRLEVLASLAAVTSSALDAHRHELYLRLGEKGRPGRELLAGIRELEAIEPRSPRVACCDDAAILLERAWPAVELVLVQAPSAADALRLCASRVTAGAFVDLAMLDGHYLRRSDAEIFGEPSSVGEHRP